jgi:DNA-binding CsgD family transcriptional regulator
LPTGTHLASLPDFIDSLEAQCRAEPLTPSEDRALLLLSHGCTLAVIADVTDSNEQTVKAHLAHARAKTCARSSAAAIYHCLLAAVWSEPSAPAPLLDARDRWLVAVIARGGLSARAADVAEAYARPASARSAYTRLARRVGARSQPNLVRLAWGWSPSPLDCVAPSWYVSGEA